jgi:hypothetical protein
MLLLHNSFVIISLSYFLLIFSADSSLKLCGVNYIYTKVKLKKHVEFTVALSKAIVIFVFVFLCFGVKKKKIRRKINK